MASVDEGMARRAASGDRGALAALLDAHYPAILRVCGHVSRRRDLAEDAAQEACVRIASSTRGFRCGSAVSTWIQSVAVNAARDQLRREASHVGRLMAAFADPTYGLAHVGDEAWLDGALGLLEPDPRETAALPAPRKGFLGLPTAPSRY